MALEPDTQLGWRFLGELEPISADPPGMSRPSYGERESDAHRSAERIAVELGVDVRRDAAGNLYLELAGTDPASSCIIGSHLDTVPHGGNFDGAAGVAVGLSVLGGVRRSARRLRRSVVVMAIRAEESAWFNASYVGSRAALGDLEPGELDAVVRSDTGRSLREHMAGAGFEPGLLLPGVPLLHPSSVAAYLEPHIEQGPVLAAAGCPVGIVTAIRGSFRYRQASCIGRWDHSGATPRDHRADAVVATARLVVELDDAWRDFLGRNEDLAVTIGQFSTDPAMHAFSKVGGRVDFSLDVRSTSRETLQHFEDVIHSRVSDIEREHDVSFTLGPRSSSTPATLDPGLLQRSAAIADTLDLTYQRLPSGAGHDCAVFANAGVPSAMVFMRSTGGSHNPAERLDEADFAAGARVVARLVEEVAA
jgi:beta-ureidopropionase / N-carbamoyl-L-amino-acid hydrolase